jgi:hypothetical protein
VSRGIQNGGEVGPITGTGTAASPRELDDTVAGPSRPWGRSAGRQAPGAQMTKGRIAVGAGVGVGDGQGWPPPQNAGRAKRGDKLPQAGRGTLRRCSGTRRGLRRAE